MKAQTITIIGLGRVGASIGLAVKGKLPVTVIGHDPNPQVAQAAKEKIGAVDQTEGNLPKAVSKADILVITIPISELEGTLRAAGSDVQTHTLILDFSNLKGPGLKWAKQHLPQGHYVGAAPVLAAKWLDDGRTNNSTATPDLFQNSLLCLMPAPDAEPQAVDTAVNFGIVLGARPYFIDAAEYDALVQGTETLPGLIAAALFKTLQQSISWKDMLRFVGLPFALDTLPLARHQDIAFMALNDKIATLHWLETLVNELNTLRRLVYEGEREVLTAVLEQSSIERDKWLLKRQENNWDERSLPDVDQPTLMAHMFGGLVADSAKKEKKRNEK
jgi:prephenate dehydrogenase